MLRKYIYFSFWISLFLSIILQIYIQSFPLWNPNCSWPEGSNLIWNSRNSNLLNNNNLKLLSFGDPQIRGTQNTSWRMKFDIHANDIYLGNIFKSLMKYLNPSPDAAFVLGDLLSSQWISDDEFINRIDNRYTKILFPKNLRPKYFFNVSGNHDIGYAGEMSHARVQRYENRCGKLNFIKKFNQSDDANIPFPWKLIVINSLALDSPIHFQEFQDDTLLMLDQIATDGDLNEHPDSLIPTVLLIHVPLHKPEGYCTDSPQTLYYPSLNTIRSQNFISYNMSQRLLNDVFLHKPSGKIRPGLILTGHDHEGCITTHSFDHSNNKWFPIRHNGSLYKFKSVFNDTHPFIPELTVRSMMGDFGGNAALTTIHSTNDQNNTQWIFSYSLCSIGLMLYWWIAYISIPITFILGLTYWSLYIRRYPKSTKAKGD